MFAMRRWVLLASCLLGCATAEPALASDAAGEAKWSRSSLLAAWNRLRGDEYALDGVERWLEPGQRVSCDAGMMVSYRGKRLRYAGSLLVSEPFRERLERFEALVAEVGREVYGREPRFAIMAPSAAVRPAIAATSSVSTPWVTRSTWWASISDPPRRPKCCPTECRARCAHRFKSVWVAIGQAARVARPARCMRDSWNS